MSLCDNCKKELKGFEGDEWENQYLCSDCLKKTPYHIFRSIHVIQTRELKLDIDSHFELEEKLNRIQQNEISCDICEHSWRVPSDQSIEEEVRKHFVFHKSQLDKDKKDLMICPKCKQGKLIFIEKKEQYCEKHNKHTETIDFFQCDNQDCNNVEYNRIRRIICD